MHDLYCLTKRNILRFLRDKVAIFFSMFSIIILVFVFSFIGGMFKTDELRQVMNDNQLSFMVNAVMIGGVLVINSANLSLGNLGTLVDDLSTSRIDSLLVSPVRRFKIILSYYISTLIITTIFTILMWLLFILVFGISTGIFFDFDIILMTMLIIVFYVFISSAFMILLATFIKSINAFGAVAGVFGTLIGFLTGIYIPLVILPDFMNKISSLLPFTHMTIYLKQLLLRQSMELLPLEQMSQDEIDSLMSGLGIKEIGVLGFDVNIHIILLVSSILAILALIYASIRLTKILKK